MLLHDIDKNEHAVHVCFVVHERLCHRLADGLEACKVDDGINLVVREDLVHSCAVANVGLDEDDLVADDFLNATDCLGLRIIEVIYNNHAVACFV